MCVMLRTIAGWCNALHMYVIAAVDVSDVWLLGMSTDCLVKLCAAFSRNVPGVA